MRKTNKPCRLLPLSQIYQKDKILLSSGFIDLKIEQVLASFSDWVKLQTKIAKLAAIINTVSLVLRLLLVIKNPDKLIQGASTGSRRGRVLLRLLSVLARHKRILFRFEYLHKPQESHVLDMRLIDHAYLLDQDLRQHLYVERLSESSHADFVADVDHRKIILLEYGEIAGEFSDDRR